MYVCVRTYIHIYKYISTQSTGMLRWVCLGKRGSGEHLNQENIIKLLSN